MLSKLSLDSLKEKKYGEWQDIETAPKNGEPFFALLYYRYKDGEEVFFKATASYFNNKYQGCGCYGTPVKWLPSPPLPEGKDG